MENEIFDRYGQHKKYFEHPRWTKKDTVEVSIKCAEFVLPIFENRYPNDDRPRKAIEAAKAWLENPTSENENMAFEASLHAHAASCNAQNAEMLYVRNTIYDAAGAAAYTAAFIAGNAIRQAPSMYALGAVEYEAARETYEKAFLADKLDSAAYTAVKESLIAARVKMLEKINAVFNEQLSKLT